MTRKAKHNQQPAKGAADPAEGEARPLLDAIEGPADLHALSDAELALLALEVRKHIIDEVVCNLFNVGDEDPDHIIALYPFACFFSEHVGLPAGCLLIAACLWEVSHPLFWT